MLWPRNLHQPKDCSPNDWLSTRTGTSIGEPLSNTTPRASFPEWCSRRHLGCTLNERSSYHIPFPSLSDPRGSYRSLADEDIYSVVMGENLRSQPCNTVQQANSCSFRATRGEKQRTTANTSGSVLMEMSWTFLLMRRSWRRFDGLPKLRTRVRLPSPALLQHRWSA
jgi:hypothetical protein